MGQYFKPCRPFLEHCTDAYPDGTRQSPSLSSEQQRSKGLSILQPFLSSPSARDASVNTLTSGNLMPVGEASSMARWNIGSEATPKSTAVLEWPEARRRPY